MGPLGPPVPDPTTANLLPPTLQPGDAYIFDDGRIEEVVAVEGDAVHWTANRTLKFDTSRDVLQPRVVWSDADTQGDRAIRARTGSLWPLAVGNRVQFTAERTEQTRDGSTLGTVENWSCAVAARQQLDTRAGQFDVWRVECNLAERRGDLIGGGQRVLYYAPAIGYFVRRDDIGTDQTAHTIEMTDYRSADPSLPLTAQRVRSQALQDALETKPSGTSVVWRAGDDEVNGAISPIRTFRAALAHYCRDYDERIDWQGRQYHVLATACRNGRGQWQVTQGMPSQKAEATLPPSGG